MNKTLIFLFTFSYIFLTSCGDSTTTTYIDNSINEIAQISQTTFNVIWIAHFTKPIITKMKLDGSIVGEFPTGESPGGMIIKDDFLWVANGMSDFLSKVERETGKTLETF